MFGNNPLRPPAKGDGSMLEVQEIFPTLQGEGPYVGRPSIFIRLGGCNLACNFCDTEFESFTTMALDNIMDTVLAYARVNRPLIVLTGGEPLRQSIAPLCDALLDAGFAIQIETNGTLFRELDERVEWICSPKANAQGYGTLRPDVAQRISALKFIISMSAPHYNNVPNIGQRDDTPIYVQPMDEDDAAQNAANLARAIALTQEHGYFLSVQLHKIIGVA